MTEKTLLDLTADIVEAVVSRNVLTPEALPVLIISVYASLTQASTGAAARSSHLSSPAVPIKKSVFPEYIVCLEDGKRFKTLKRHLRTSYHMTPEQYREKWGLPSGYPMVAPDYGERRSTLAKKNGLGRKAGELVTSPEAPARRGRPRKQTAAE